MAAAAAGTASSRVSDQALTRWYQSRETRGCRGTMLSTAEKKVCVQTEKHDNVCPLALCFAPFSSCHPVSRDQGTTTCLSANFS